MLSSNSANYLIVKNHYFMFLAVGLWRMFAKQ